MNHYPGQMGYGQPGYPPYGQPSPGMPANYHPAAYAQYQHQMMMHQQQQQQIAQQQQQQGQFGPGSQSYPTSSSTGPAIQQQPRPIPSPQVSQSQSSQPQPSPVGSINHHSHIAPPTPPPAYSQANTPSNQPQTNSDNSNPQTVQVKQQAGQSVAKQHQPVSKKPSSTKEQSPKIVLTIQKFHLEISARVNVLLNDFTENSLASTFNISYSTSHQTKKTLAYAKKMMKDFKILNKKAYALQTALTKQLPNIKDYNCPKQVPSFFWKAVTKYILTILQKTTDKFYQKSVDQICDLVIATTDLAEKSSQNDEDVKAFGLKSVVENILPVINEQLIDEDIKYKRHSIFVTRISKLVCQCIEDRNKHKLTYRDIRLWLRLTISILMKIEKKRALANRYLAEENKEKKIDSLIRILKLCFDRNNNILPAYQALIASRAEIHHELEVPEVGIKKWFKYFIQT